MMKAPYLSFISFLSILFIVAINSCSPKSSQGIEEIETSNQLRAIFAEGLCCQNLIAIDEFDLPDSCGSPYAPLFGINLNDFDLQDHSFGDTLFIEFNFIGACEAEADIYDCIITCDIRHGTPVQILSINSN